MLRFGALWIVSAPFSIVFGEVFDGFRRRFRFFDFSIFRFFFFFVCLFLFFVSSTVVDFLGKKKGKGGQAMVADLGGDPSVKA